MASSRKEESKENIFFTSFYKVFAETFLIVLLLSAIISTIVWFTGTSSYKKQAERFEHAKNWNLFLDSIHQNENLIQKDSAWKLAQDLISINNSFKEIPEAPLVPNSLTAVYIDSASYPNLIDYFGCVFTDDTLSHQCDKEGTFDSVALNDLTLALSSDPLPDFIYHIEAKPHRTNYTYFLFLLPIIAYLVAIFAGTFNHLTVEPRSWQNEKKESQPSPLFFFSCIVFPIPFLFYVPKLLWKNHKRHVEAKRIEQEKIQARLSNPFVFQIEEAEQAYRQLEAFSAQYPKSIELKEQKKVLEQILVDLRESPTQLELQTTTFVAESLVNKAKDLQLQVKTKIEARKEMGV